jgi:hypothetical protein
MGSHERGIWAITGTTVDHNFESHTDRIKLPLNPAGCTGLDSGGAPVLVHACKPLPKPVAPHSTSALDFFRQTPTPGPADIARQNAAYAQLLESAPWKITGMGWTVTRIFAKDGTFTTDDHPLEFGTWKIANGKISLFFNGANGHIDTIDLPLDPDGTEAADRLNIPEIAIMVRDTASTGNAPTPAPTAAPSTPAPTPPPASSATPSPARTVTPPPFGREMPPGP